LFVGKAGVFDSKDAIDRAFMAEMVNAWDLLEKLPEEAADAHPDGYAIVLGGVEAIVNHHDTYSVQYRHAQDIAEQVVEKVLISTIYANNVQLMKDFKTLYGTSGATELFTAPPAALIRANMVRSFLYTRKPSDAYGQNGLSKDPAVAALQLCAPDAPTCSAYVPIE